MRAEEINKIQSALENELVRAKLHAYGLTAEEVDQKVDRMTNEQIHLLAQASDDILAGGNGVGLALGFSWSSSSWCSSCSLKGRGFKGMPTGRF
jgi:hypothetical protein